MNDRFSLEVKHQQLFLDFLARNAMLSNRNLYEDALQTDELVYEVVPMDGIGPMQNPFHYDSTSSGTPIAGDVMGMFYTPMKDKALERFYFHNNTTGQRTRIAVMAKNPKPKKILYFSSGNMKEFIHNDMFHTLKVVHEADGHLYSYASTKSSPHINKMDTSGKPRPWHIRPAKNANTFDGIFDPVWYVSDGIGILIVDGKPAISQEEYETYYGGDMVDDKNFKKAYASLQKALGAI